MADVNRNLSHIERVNEDVTRAFVQAWSDQSCDQLMPLLADHVSYAVYEGGPTHVGTAAVEKALQSFMFRFERIEFEILRLSVIGPVVIHERTEHFYVDGELDTRFHVVGQLLIRDGKIEDWRDYAIPGVEQIVGPVLRGE